MGLAAFQWDIRVGKLQERLSEGHISMINDIQVLHDEAGVGCLIIKADAWDDVNQRYRFLDEGVLSAGTVVWPYIGYGSASRCLGRYVVARKIAEYNNGGMQVHIEACDGMQRLRWCEKARIFDLVVNDTLPVSLIALEHGLIPSISPLPAQAITRPRPVVKENGMTDLEFLQLFSKLYGYEPPHVEYVEGIGETLFLRARMDTWMQTPVETLWYRPSAKKWSFGAAQAQMASLKIDDDTGDVPTAVEVVGFDADGKIVLVRAEYSPLGVQVTKDYEWAKQTDNYEAAGMVEDGVLLKLRVEGEGKSTLPGGGSFAEVSTLEGSAMIPVPDKSTAVVSGSFIESEVAAEEYAKSYFADKMGKSRLVEGEYSNIKGIEEFRVHSVYALDGVANEHKDRIVITSVRHNITKSSGHVVSFAGHTVVKPGTEATSSFAVISGVI